MRLTPTINPDSLIKYRKVLYYPVWLARVMYKCCYGNYYYCFWKLYCYEVKIYHYDKFIFIIELLEWISLDCFNNPFLTDTGNLAKNIHLLDETYDGETFYTCLYLCFSSSAYNYTQGITISGLTINTTSSSDSTLVDSTIFSQHTAEK